MTPTCQRNGEIICGRSCPNLPSTVRRGCIKCTNMRLKILQMELLLHQLQIATLTIGHTTIPLPQLIIDLIIIMGHILRHRSIVDLSRGNPILAFQQPHHPRDLDLIPTLTTRHLQQVMELARGTLNLIAMVILFESYLLKIRLTVDMAMVLPG